MGREDWKRRRPQESRRPGNQGFDPNGEPQSVPTSGKEEQGCCVPGTTAFPRPEGGDVLAKSAGSGRKSPRTAQNTASISPEITESYTHGGLPPLVRPNFLVGALASLSDSDYPGNDSIIVRRRHRKARDRTCCGRRAVWCDGLQQLPSPARCRRGHGQASLPFHFGFNRKSSNSTRFSAFRYSCS